MSFCGDKKLPMPKLTRKKLYDPSRRDHTKLLCMHRPTRISKLQDSVQLPPYRPVKDAPPSWKTTPLNHKIAMYHGNGPNGPLTLHRGLMGNSPFRPLDCVKMDFSLSDPYCRQISYEYNPLHDPHLRGWMDSAKTRKFLQKQGVITRDQEVVCDLKQYNEYRHFLWRQHSYMVKKKLEEQDALFAQKRRVNLANEIHKKAMKNLIKCMKSDRPKKKPYKSPPIVITTDSNESNGVKRHKFARVKNGLIDESIKIKKIETFTEYGLKKNGLVDYSNPIGTFFKGSPEDYNLIGFADGMFKPKKK